MYIVYIPIIADVQKQCKISHLGNKRDYNDCLFHICTKLLNGTVNCPELLNVNGLRAPPVTENNTRNKSLFNYISPSKLSLLFRILPSIEFLIIVINTYLISITLKIIVVKK